jgi:hypothetical protein
VVKRALLLALLTTLPGSMLPAQERPESRLVLSLFGGVSGGSPLWEVNRQPLLVLGTELAPRYDTLRLSRRLNAGVVLGLTGTVFRSARVGISGEMLFMGLTTDDGCSLAYEAPGADSSRRNSQLCGDVSARSATPTTVAFSLGAVLRPIPRAAVSPYARFQAGLGLRSGSVTEMVGSFTEGSTRQTRLVINDRSNGRIVPALALAGGLMTPLGPGYQVRLELRDQVLFMRRVSGPADSFNQALAPTEPFVIHSLTLTAGLDIVLEQKRGRRY